MKIVKRAIKVYGRSVDGSTARIPKTDPVLQRRIDGKCLAQQSGYHGSQKGSPFERNVPAGIINVKVKPLSGELHDLTKRVRLSPTGGLGGQIKDEEEEDDDALLMCSVKQWLKATPSKKEMKKEIHKDVKKEIKTPASGKGTSHIPVRTVKSKPSGLRVVITPVTPQ